MNTSFERGNNRTDEWYTPKWLIDALGPFDLDPCAPSEQFYTAQRCYTKEIDGLSQDWDGRVWLNPPYKNPLIGKFMKRLAEHGNGIGLVFNRMDTALWHDVIFPSATAIRILRGRLKFVGTDGKEPACGAGCGSVLVAFGEDNADMLERCGINGKFIRMNDYPKFTFDKSRIPDIPSGLCEEFKEYARRQMQYIQMPDPYVPSMSFEKFVELMRKHFGVMVIDEPTLPRKRLAVPLNPERKSLWLEEFEKWLKR